MKINIEELSKILGDEGWYHMQSRILDEGVGFRNEKYAHPWKSDEELKEYLKLHIGEETLIHCLKRLNNE